VKIQSVNVTAAGSELQVVLDYIVIATGVPATLNLPVPVG
jgi:hypothetical protein